MDEKWDEEQQKIIKEIAREAGIKVNLRDDFLPSGNLPPRNSEIEHNHSGGSRWVEGGESKARGYMKMVCVGGEDCPATMIYRKEE